METEKHTECKPAIGIIKLKYAIEWKRYTINQFIFIDTTVNENTLYTESLRTVVMESPEPYLTKSVK